MNILVAGANGKTGLQIVEHLIEQNHKVMAMIRDNSQSKEFEKRGALPYIADLERDVEFAVEGSDAVIFAAGSGPNTSDEKTWSVDRDGVLKLIDACQRNGVERFILLSSVGTDQPEKGPEEMETYLKAKAQSEEHLKQSKLNYTIVRPVTLNDNAESGKVIATNELGGNQGEVSRADVALTIARTVQNPNTYHKTFELMGGGSEDIDSALNNL